MGGRSILRHFRLPDRINSHWQVFFPQPKILSLVIHRGEKLGICIAIKSIASSDVYRIARDSKLAEPRLTLEKLGIYFHSTYGEENRATKKRREIR